MTVLIVGYFIIINFKNQTEVELSFTSLHSYNDGNDQLSLYLVIQLTSRAINLITGRLAIL